MVGGRGARGRLMRGLFRTPPPDGEVGQVISDGLPAALAVAIAGMVLLGLLLLTGRV